MMNVCAGGLHRTVFRAALLFPQTLLETVSSNDSFSYKEKKDSARHMAGEDCALLCHLVKPDFEMRSFQPKL